MSPSPLATAVPVLDPVCGMTINSADAAARLEYGGETYHFCSQSCGERFKKAPRQYLEPDRSPATARHVDVTVAKTTAADNREYICPMDPEVRQVGPGPCPQCGMALEPVSSAPTTRTEWACPMHPEVVQDQPGPCPICGMALEPRTVTLDERSPELEEMVRRFRWSLALTAPMLAVMVAEILFGQTARHLLPTASMNWLQLLLATPVVVWGGLPFFVRGWMSIVNRHLNMFTLIALGVGAAYGFSIVATLAPGLFPPGFRTHGNEVGVYFEPAAVIIVLVLLGQVLELRARSQTSSAIRRLLGLAPATAIRVDQDGREYEVALEHVRVGDRLRVRPGGRVPVDGTVVEGVSTVDESMISGEPIPVEKSVSAHVTGGTINGTGTFILEAQRVGSDTLLAHIVRLVGDAQRSRAPIQRLADAVSGWFVPTVIVASLGTFAVWALWGTEPRLPHALVNAVAVLIIACPCALGLATPMSIMVGTGRGAELGVLLRNAEALEILDRVDTVVLDKTGTLTDGKPTLTRVITEPRFDETTLLRLVASLERASEHPLADAIVRGTESRGIRTVTVSDFRSLTGRGVIGTVDGRTVAIGNRLLLAETGVSVPSTNHADELRLAGGTVMLVAIDGRYAGLVGVADRIKPTAIDAVRELRADGLQIVMLTGDNRLTAEAVGRSVGIDTVYADVRPEQKVEVIRQLQAEGRRVAMAGDGINDAPALAQAEVGIAMGTGTDVAMESAGVTLVQGDLRGVLRARRLSRATMRNIRQNLFFAFVYNALGVPLAAGVLYPAFGVLLSPIIASAAMTFSSVSVIGNALRLRRESLG